MIDANTYTQIADKNVKILATEFSLNVVQLCRRPLPSSASGERLRISLSAFCAVRRRFINSADLRSGVKGEKTRIDSLDYE